MKIQGIPHRSIEVLSQEHTVRIVDQTYLPHEVVWRTLRSVDDAAEAIRVMRVRGAPLIGATAAYGYYLAMRDNASNAHLAFTYEMLLATRPTAVNLRWALDRMRGALQHLPEGERAQGAWEEAASICEDDVKSNHTIGRHGLVLFQKVLEEKRRKGGEAQLHVMTHCNAGWIACVDWGTALAPIYLAHDAGLPVHVWVSETRPRGQGASLTAWELKEHGVPHTLVVDNEAGHLMQRGMVDVCIVGADRVTAHGDVANKIGTYMKALAAQAHGVPFYVALPVSTIDWTITDGVKEITIEQRSAREVTHVVGLGADGQRQETLICPAGTAARNDGFDVTPAALVTALITDEGVFAANDADLSRLREQSETGVIPRRRAAEAVPA